MKSKRFYYAYGIIETEEPGACLIASQENMSAVHYRDLALVFSEVASSSLQVTKENALAHHRVIAQIMQEQTIIPFRFGIIFNKTEEMTGILAASYEEIKKTLKQLENKLELGLKVIWKKEALANKLERDYEHLKRFKEEILNLPSEQCIWLRYSPGAEREGGHGRDAVFLPGADLPPTAGDLAGFPAQ